MAKSSTRQKAIEVRTRRAYFDCRFGQLHVRTAFPTSGGFDEATTLICIHGPQTASRIFAALLQVAASDRSVYAPDLPGCGESDPTPPSASAGDLAGALVDFAAELRLRRFDLLAAAGGQPIAAEMALARRDSVRHIALLGVDSSLDPERLAALQPQLLWLRTADDNEQAAAKCAATLRQSTQVMAQESAANLLGSQAAFLAATLRKHLI